MKKTIPILVDDIKNYKNFNMTRCTYFSIESNDEISEWILSIKKMKIPFYLTRLCGIICFSKMNGRYFNNVSDINKVFNTIENHQSLFIDVNEIWFPNFIFKDQNKRGNVFRISPDLFQLGLNFSNNSISLQKFINYCEEYHNVVMVSKKETDAFIKWSESEVQYAKNLYLEKEKSSLKWDDNRGLKELRNG